MHRGGESYGRGCRKGRNVEMVKLKYQRQSSSWRCFACEDLLLSKFSLSTSKTGTLVAVEADAGPANSFTAVTGEGLVSVHGGALLIFSPLAPFLQHLPAGVFKR